MFRNALGMEPSAVVLRARGIIAAVEFQINNILKFNFGYEHGFTTDLTANLGSSAEFLLRYNSMLRQFEAELGFQRRYGDFTLGASGSVECKEHFKPDYSLKLYLEFLFGKPSRP